MTEIIALGEILIDLTQTGAGPGGVPQFAAYPGGAPANVAVAAARLGARTAFVGRAGRDGLGDYLARVLAENGVDPSGLRRDRAATTLAVVTVDAAGERDFTFLRGADACLAPEDLDPAARRWTCPICGAEHHRGRNGAENLRDRGLAQFYEQQGLDLPA